MWEELKLKFKAYPALLKYLEDNWINIGKMFLSLIALRPKS